MRSRLDMWPPLPEGPPRPWVDWTEALADRWHAVAMDQRNAGRSTGAIASDHGWHIYAAAQLALMDHLGNERCHNLGCCIGVSFALKLCEIAPERINAVVLQNPIGLNLEYPTVFPDGFRDWADELQEARPDLEASALNAFSENLWRDKFVFSVGREFVKDCHVPALVLPGNDKPHPAAIGSELADLLPEAEQQFNWKGPDYLGEQHRRVVGFLEKHTPKAAAV